MTQLLTDQAAEIARDYIEKAEARIARIDEALARDAVSLSLVAHGWIVVTRDQHPIAMEYIFKQIAGGKRKAVDVKAFADLLTTPRFTEEDARTLAAVTGNEEVYVAMHWTDAAHRSRAALVDLIENLKQGL